jgi:predicted ATPase
MLTQIYIDNFRCFVNFEYRPERKQLLLGANGSGKSSLIDAIKHIKRFVAGDDNPFTQSTRTRWQDKSLQVFEIEALLERERHEYRIEIRFDPETKQPSVKLERLRVDGATVFELAQGMVHFFSDDRSQLAPQRLETTNSALHLSQLSNLRVRRFAEWLETMHCFRIDAYPDAMDDRADSGEGRPGSEFERLAGWYRRLVTAHPDHNLRFLKSMKSALDGFQGLRFVSEEDGTQRLRADFTAPTNKRVNYSLAELSEGQRCLLALYMTLHFLIAEGHTVFIDEPDNFIALREIQPWLLASEAEVDDHEGQLILVSHHPEILNQWASKYGLRFFREENGHVRTERFRTDPNGSLQPSELIARGWEDE